MIRDAGTARDEHELLHAITGGLADVLGADVTGAFEYLPDTETALLQAGVGWTSDSIGHVRVPAGPGSAARRVLNSEGPVLAFESNGDAPGDAVRSELLGGQAFGRGWATHISGPDRTFGYLCAFGLDGSSLAPDASDLIAAAAEAAANGLARLRMERRLATGQGIVSLIEAASDLATASRRMLELIGSGIGWEAAAIWLPDEAERRLTCFEEWSAPGTAEAFSPIRRGQTDPLHEGPAGEVWASGEPLWVGDLRSETRFDMSLPLQAGLNSALYFPIVARGRVAGVVELLAHAVQQPDRALMADLAVFGSQIGVLLERELAQRDLQRLTAELQLFLDNLGSGVIAINPDGSLRFANAAAADGAGLSSADDLLTTDIGELMRDVRLFTEEGRELSSSGPLARRILNGETVGPTRIRVAVPGRADRWYQIRGATVRTGETDAPWVIVTFDDVSELKRHEVSLRRSEAAHRRIGEVLQRGLMPPAVPDIPQIDMAVKFRALGDRTMIGGDFYDVFPVPGKSWMIVVGDVAGKGSEAAAFTALVRYTIRAIATRDPDPAKVLRRVNEILVEDPTHPRLCTALCALVEAGAGKYVTIARGGHLPALLLGHSAKSPARVAPAGPILGAFAGATFAERTVTLGPGDTLLMFTDGISDAGAHNGQGTLGVEGLEAVLSTAAGRSAEQIVNAVDAAARTADRGQQADDALVVVARGR